MELSALGKLSNACAKADEVLPRHVGGSSHHSLTASDIGNDNNVFIDIVIFFSLSPTKEQYLGIAAKPVTVSTDSRNQVLSPLPLWTYKQG